MLLILKQSSMTAITSLALILISRQPADCQNLQNSNTTFYLREGSRERMKHVFHSKSLNYVNQSNYSIMSSLFQPFSKHQNLIQLILKHSFYSPVPNKRLPPPTHTHTQTPPHTASDFFSSLWCNSLCLAYANTNFQTSLHPLIPPPPPPHPVYSVLKSIHMLI